MARVLAIHPVNPQLRLIRQVVECIRDGGIIVYPTDSAYALGCAVGNKAAQQAIVRIRQVDSKTIGIRVPDHPVVAALLAELNEPILSSSLIMPGETEPLFDMDDITARLAHDADLIIDSGFCGREATTVVDLEEGAPQVLRHGKGDPAPFQ